MGSSGLGETMSTHIGNAMAEDPKAFCTDVGIGTTTTSQRQRPAQQCCRAAQPGECGGQRLPNAACAAARQLRGRIQQPQAAAGHPCASTLQLSQTAMPRWNTPSCVRVTLVADTSTVPWRSVATR